MSTLVFDMEADNLYDDVTKMWTICAQDVDTGETFRFVEPCYSGDWSGSLTDGLAFLRTATCLIGHNIIDYDFRVFRKLYNWQYHGRVVDTMLLSQLLRPDRYGGHSLAEWGKRVGHKKPEHSEWDRFSPEMLHRCSEDVAVNVKVYRALLKEAGEPLEGVALWPLTIG
jgi:hypothetical protein